MYLNGSSKELRVKLFFVLYCAHDAANVFGLVL